MRRELAKQMNLQQILKDAGIFQYGVTDTLKFGLLRKCGLCVRSIPAWQLWKNMGMPPALGSVEECRERIQRFQKMLVFSMKIDLEDSFDYEGMMAGMKQFKKSCRAIGAAIRPYIRDCLMLSNEGCDLCEKCTYPDAACRFPEQSPRLIGRLWGFCERAC